MKKQLILVTIALAATLHLWADVVPVTQAQALASQFLQKNSTQRARVAGRPVSSSPALKLCATGEASSYYIFNVGTDEGFVVVSGDDATEEILGYSYSGSIHPDSMPCNMRMLFDSYTDQIKFLREHGITREMNSPRKKASKKELGMLSYMIDEDRRCSFDQYSPYNDFCPIVDGIHSLTGCTATALAGLMYAFKMPRYTIKKIPGYQNNPSLIEYMFDFFIKDDVEDIPAHTRIDWSNILPKYGNRDYDENNNLISDENGQIKLDVFSNVTSEQKTAVANLMKLAGTSIKAVYSPNGTDAPLDNVPYALVSYFGYDDHVFYADRDNYDRETWLGMIRNEILNCGPVMYRGTQKVIENGKIEYHGHAFLLEGFEDHRFYVNFGWSGDGNGLYLLDLFEGDGTLLNYNLYQGAVFNVLPLPRFDLEVAALSLENGNVEERAFKGSTLKGTMMIRNLDNAAFNDTLFIRLSRGFNDVDSLYEITIPVHSTRDVAFEFRGLKNGYSYTLKALMGAEKMLFYESPELECEMAVPEMPDDDSEDVANHDLTHYEYWFDDDFTSRQRVSISGTKKDIVTAISTDGVHGGPHIFNMRLRQDDGSYSPVSSSVFMKGGMTTNSDTYIDYWFDDDFDNKQAFTLSGGQTRLEDAVSCAGLTDGLHTLNMRLRISEDAFAGYSSISSTVFYKNIDNKVAKMMYWFEEDFEHRVTTDLPAAGASGLTTLTIDLSDMRKFPIGLHRLNLCFATAAGTIVSPPYKFVVLKMASGTVNKLEYWVDDNYDGRKTISGIFETIDGEFVFADPFSLADVPFGSHTVNCRAVMDGGYSSVSSAHVMRVGKGATDKIEYWVDNNLADAKTVSGTYDPATGEYVFVNPFDLSDVSNGVHRVYYRVVSNPGEPATGIDKMTVIVKSMYGPGPALMTSYSIVADDETELASGTLNMAQEVEFNYTVDASSLGEGTHTLTTTFWNTYGGSVTDVSSVWVTGPLTGDVNSDGQVGIGDIVAITNFMAGNANGISLLKADVNGDGQVGIGDIVAITNIMAGVGM